MDALLPDSLASAQTLLAFLVAAVIALAALLAASITCRNAHRAGAENRHAAAALIAGAASIVELAAFGVLGAPFAVVLGIASLVKARAYRTRTDARSGLYRLGFATGVFGIVASVFSIATVAAALVL